MIPAKLCCCSHQAVRITLQARSCAAARSGSTQTNRAAQMHGKALQQHLTYFSSLTSSLDLKKQQTKTEQTNKQTK